MPDIGHPVYGGVALPWQERLQLGRRYGKYDFGRFEHLVGSGHYLGQGTIGDIEVACKFLFRESKWGVLNKNPGGVVYLDLTFTEPSNCRLKSATVTLTLDEEDKDLRHQFSAGNPLIKPRVPVQITEHGPQVLQGQLDEVFKITKYHGSPWVDVGGFAGAGGIGRDLEKRYVQRSQWKFSSVTKPNKLARPTILKWHLVESELDCQPRHDNTFHTAFAFEHDGQPFLMQVEVSGYLEGIASHLGHKMKTGLKKFKFPVEPQMATTLVNFGGRENDYKDPLDELAKNIPHNMVEKNLKPIPQVPNMPSNPGLYCEYVRQEHEPSIKQENNEQDRSPPPRSARTSNPAELEEIRREAMELLSSGLPSITKINMARVPSTLSTVNNQPLKTATREPSTSSTTLVDQEQDGVADKVVPIESNANHREVQRILKDSALPTVLQFLILWIFAIGMRVAPPPSKGRGATS